MLQDQTAIAEAFVQARRNAQPIQIYPGTQPGTLADAYAIQDQAIRLDGRAVEGWKVGRINAPDDQRLGTNRLAGPIFSGSIVDVAAGEMPDMPVFEGGFAAAEAEFLLHVAPGFSGPVPQDDAGVRALIDRVCIGIEIASSPYPGINQDGPTVTVSDFGNNYGLVRGVAVPGWQEMDLCAVPVSMQIEGKIVGSATAATMLDGPFGATRFLLTHLQDRGIDISGGLWISTGAVTGVHAIKVSETATADFGALGTISCRITAARGQ